MANTTVSYFATHFLFEAISNYWTLPTMRGGHFGHILKLFHKILFIMEVVYWIYLAQHTFSSEVENTKIHPRKDSLNFRKLNFLSLILKNFKQRSTPKNSLYLGKWNFSALILTNFRKQES